MRPEEAPAFLLDRRILAPGKTRSPLKTARKRGNSLCPLRRDTGTPEMTQRQKVVIENRGYSSAGRLKGISGNPGGKKA